MGWAVSSPRLAAVSNPVNSRTPKSTPNRTPLSPSGEEDGLNAVATWLSPPTLMITCTKKISTTVIEVSASTSCARVDNATPKYVITATAANTTSIHAVRGSGVFWNSALTVS